MNLLPTFKLALPVLNGGERCDDEEGTARVDLGDVRQQQHSLHGLAQSHLVRQDAAAAIVPVEEQPVDAIHLPRAQHVPVRESSWLRHRLPL